MYICCENPVVIQHPHIINHIKRGEFLFLDGKEKDIDFELLWHSPADFLKRNIPTKVGDVKKFYSITEDGEALPLFIEVPCNSCKACSSKKINGIAQQFEFELLDKILETENFFVTLTYKNSKYKDVLDKKEVQNYIKRVRSYVARNVGKDEAKAIKVLYSGERGKRTKRCHYHVVFLHFPIYKIKTNQFESMLLFQYLWSDCKNYKVKNAVPFSEFSLNRYNRYTPKAQLHYDTFCKGFVHVKNVKNGNLGRYVAKYVAKTLHGAETFVRKSINFGMNYFNQQIKPQLLANGKNEFEYLNLDGVVKTCSICSYYMNKAFPTISRIIPVDIRKSFNNLRDDFYTINLYQRVIRNIDDIVKNAARDFEKVKKLVFLPWYKNIELSDEKIWKMVKISPLRSVVESFYKNLAIVYDWFDHNNVDDLRKYSNDRDMFIFNSNKLDEIDIQDRIFDLKQQYYKLQNSIKL